MILKCVLVGQKIFSARDDVKLGRERSFQNSPAARSEKIFRGLVWHHHLLKISFGLCEHTVIPHEMAQCCMLSIQTKNTSGGIKYSMMNYVHS